ncbi:MAG: hypothetical protein HKO94_10355 [Flavobacteriaceae bacterium]|nr:hypothetical protein [Flavobacteriaceae bacterium]
MKKKIALLLIAFLCVLYHGHSQIITFDFNGLVGNEATANSNVNNPNLSISTISRGSGLTAANNANRFNATSWNTIDITDAVLNDDYMEFTITPNAGYEFDISTIVINFERSSTGTRGLALRNSLDGYSANIDGEKSIADITTPQTFTFTVNQTNNNSAVTYRFYGYAEAGGGSGGFEGAGNDIIVNGSVSLTSTDQPDWCNIQFPVVNGTIQLGESYNVFSQVYEPGVTDAAGQGGGISAWIGYNSTNNNPDGGGGWIWVPATYNVDSGNNDEYQVDLGAAIPATGLYYFASRFQLNGGPYLYGGSAGVWSNDSVQLTVNPHILDWCNLQFPGTADITTGDTFDVFAQVYEPGVTDTPAVQGANIEAWVGYSSSDSDPSGAGWNWVAATYNPLCGTTCGTPENNDEYIGDIGPLLSAGTYYYASRFRIDGDVYYYGGYNAGGGGFWTSGVNVNGVVTVTDPPGSSCLEDGFDTIDGWMTHAAGNWTQNTVNGTYTGNGVYVNANDAIAEYKLGFNDADDWFELPPVDNPLLFTYWGRLSSAPGGTNRMKVQVFDGGWVDIVEHTATSTNYVQYSANLSAYSGNTNVRIRLWRSEDDRSMYIDDIEVVCVDCTPTHTISGFTPTEGPENTFVTITGTGFTAASTVFFNGASAVIHSQTNTELVVIVPSGASSGVISINESACNITTSSDFTLLNSVDANCEGGVSASELFISEITDSTYGSMTYVEIYNGTGAAVNLADYEIEITYNGNSNNTDIVTLSGTLANGDVHVIRTSTAGYTCAVPGGDGSYADQIANGLNGIDSAKNDSDCITLYKNSSPIDVWGDCTDKNWRENLGVSIGNEGFDFRRLATATFPSMTFDLSDWTILDWADGSSNTTCNENDYSDIGNFASGFPPSITTNPSTSANCDLSTNLNITATEGYAGGNSLIYNWFYHPPGDSVWTVVTDGSDYSGSTTNTLTINNVLNHFDYQYYCEVWEDDMACSQASAATRLDVQRTTWNGATWDNGVPDLNTIAIIDGDYDTGIGGLQDSFSACSLIIKASNQVVVRNGDYIEIDKDVLVNGSTSDASNIVELTIETRGSFVQNGDGINSGNFTLGSGARARVIKQTALLDNWYEYTYWSSPVIGETVESAFPDTPSNRRFRFDAQNFSDDCAEIANSNTCNPGVKDDIDDAAPYDWVNIPNGLMETGRGYAATYSLFAPYPNLIGSATFEAGAFNTGDIDVAIYRDNTVTDDNNWNLIGNPYPSAISAQQFLTENTALIEGNPGGSIQGAIFLWSHDTAPDGDTSGNEVLNFSQSDYAVINGAAGTAGGDGLSPNPYIPSGQGFFIAYDQSAGVASDTQNTVSFKNSMREIGNNTQFFEANENIQFFDSQETNEILTDKNTLWINLTSDNGVFNQIAVAYLEGATDHYDGWYYDAPKNLSTGAYSLLYSIIPGDYQKFAVQGKSLDALNQSEIIPLGFESSIEVATIYKLSLPDYNGNFLENNDIYLKDNYSDIIYNLKDSDYNFTSEPGIFNDRFEIVFTNETLGLDDTEVRNGLIVYEDTNGVFNIKVSDANRISAIEVTDLLGRYVYRIDGLETVHHQFDGLKLSQATYLIRVSLENGVVLTKKVVKRF